MKKIPLFLASKTFFVFILSVTIFSSFAQEIPLNPKVRTGVLENGLTYYIQNNPKPENKVELRLAIKAGSILENENQLGLAHFLEHMAFNGSDHFKKNELVDYLQSIGVRFGAHLNAYTSFDETVYMLNVPTDSEEKLQKGLDVLQDWASGMSLENEEIDKERGVIMEEYRLRLGANQRMLEKTLPIIAKDSRYAERLPIGKKEVIENFEYQVIKDFYNDWYRPNLMGIFIVGDIDVDSIENKIKKRFAQLDNPKNEKERIYFDMPDNEGTAVAIAKDKEATSNYIGIINKINTPYKAPQTEEELMFFVKQNLLSTMLNARYSELAQSANPPFLYAYSYYSDYFSPTKAAFQSFAVVPNGGYEKALETLLIENKKAAEFGFLSSEFDRAKKQLLTMAENEFAERDKKESSSIIQEYVSHYLNGMPAPNEEWWLNFLQDNIDKIDLNKLNELIKSWLLPDNRIVTLQGADKPENEIPSEQDVRNILNKDIQIEAYSEEKLPESIIDQWLPKGEVKSVNTISKEAQVQHLVLSNGINVYFKKTDFKNDEIIMSVFSPGGYSLISDKDFEKIEYVDDMLNNAGVGNFNNNQLEKFMTGKDINLRAYINNYEEGFYGSARPADFELALQLLHAQFLGFNKDEESYQSFIEKEKAQYANLASNPNYYFYEQIELLSYKKHPRISGYPKPTDFDKQDYNLLIKTATQRFENPADFNFVFVGNIPDNFTDLVSTYLASLPTKPSSNENFKDLDFQFAGGNTTKIIKKGVDPKSMVRIIYNGETDYNKEDALNLKVAAEVLEIELTEILREDMGGVYTLWTNASLGRIPKDNFSFMINFPCGPEKADTLKETTLNQLKKLANEGPSQKNLNKVKETLMVENKEYLEKNSFWRNQIKNMLKFNDPIEDVFKLEVALGKITEESVKKIAAKLLQDNYFVAILMPEDN